MREALRARVFAAVLASLVLAAGGCARSDTPAPRPATGDGAPTSASGEPRVRSFSLTTSDLTEEEAFLRALDFTERAPETRLSGAAFDTLVGLAGSRARTVTVGLGAESLVLTAFDAPRGRPIPEPARSNDLWFEHTAIVVGDMGRAYARLRELGARAVSSAPQTIPRENPAAGGVQAYYFRDTDGHDLEIIRYPEGKGDPRWQDTRGRLFLGLDHSAIAVSDTSRSLAFYRDALGLHVAGESLNSGVEQEELSGVPGARVRITGLRGAGGPGVELLEYVAPKGGRAFPESTSADVVHWEITLEVPDLAVAIARARVAGVTFVSRGVADVGALAIGARRAVVVRDPDGHSVRLVER